MSETGKPILTLGEWAKDVRNRKPPRWLIHSILPADNLVLLSGVPKSAQKTFLAMTCALIVATGKSVGSLKCLSAEKVLYIYEEGDRPGTLARFDALAAGHGFGSVDGMANLFLAHRLGFSLDRDEWITKVGDFVRQHNIKLVIIDTLAKCMQGDENNAQAVGSAIRATNVFRQAECSVMFVHHTRKEDSRLTNRSYGTPEPDYDIRGSSALCGTYETHLAVRAYHTGLEHELESYLLVGGKEFAWRAYPYGFAFTNEKYEGEYGTEERMTHCRLELGTCQELPYIEQRAKSAKKDKET